MKCAAKISEFLEPIIDKRKHYENRIQDVLDILEDGEIRARKVAEETMDDVHNHMKIG